MQLIHSICIWMCVCVCWFVYVWNLFFSVKAYTSSYWEFTQFQTHQTHKTLKKERHSNRKKTLKKGEFSDLFCLSLPFYSIPNKSIIWNLKTEWNRIRKKKLEILKLEIVCLVSFKWLHLKRHKCVGECHFINIWTRRFDSDAELNIIPNEHAGQW